MTLILVKGDDIRSGTKAKAHHGQLRVAQESMLFLSHNCVLDYLLQIAKHQGQQFL